MAEKDKETRREELLKELKKLDEDEEVWIKDGGREYKVTGKRATTILDKLLDGFTDDDDDAAADDAATQPPAKDGTATRYFGAKKAAS